MTPHPYETIPSRDELMAFEDLGLREIRFRKDGSLIVGLCLTEDMSTVVAISTPEADTFHVFPVASEHANDAFEDTWPYADTTGKLVLQDILVKQAA